MKSSNQSIDIKTNKLAICTNAFAKRWFETEDISPGRGIILLTNEIPNLKLMDAFITNKDIIISEMLKKIANRWRKRERLK